MIRFADVSKTYRTLLPHRDVRAVDGVSLDVAAGERDVLASDGLEGRFAGLLERVRSDDAARQEYVEIQLEQAADAVAQPRRIVHYPLVEQAAASGRIPDYRVADNQDPPLRPIQRHLARRFTRRRHDA